MSLIEGYQSNLSLNDLNIVGDFPIDHLVGGFGMGVGVNDYHITLNTQLTQYRQGLLLQIAFGEANTGPVTINVSDRGSKALKKPTSSTLQDLVAGDLIPNRVYLVVYDGSVFQLANAATGSTEAGDASENQKGLAQIATNQEVQDGESDTKIVTPAKLAAYIAGKVTGMWRDKGMIDGTTNPEYPPAQAGDAYTVSSPGKLGGAAGQQVGTRDVAYCNVTNSGGTQDAVGNNWTILQANLEAATDVISGYVRLATQVEVSDGTSSSTAISPARLKELLDSRRAAENALGMIMLANQAEVNGGGNDTKAVTSLKLSTLLNAVLRFQGGTGSNSVIPMPASNNAAAASFASVFNGQNNLANAPYSSAVGLNAEARVFNEWVKAGGALYNTRGSSQSSILNLLNVIPGVGGLYPVIPDGNGLSTENRWIVPNNTVQQFTAQYTIVQNIGPGGAGLTWTGMYDGTVKNSAGTVSWVGGGPIVRTVKQDSGFSPGAGFTISGLEVIAFVESIPATTYLASVTVYITQTKFNLS